MSQLFADGRQADATVHKSKGVAVSELVQGASDSRPAGVLLPAFLHALVA